MAIYDDRLAQHAIWASLASATSAVEASRESLADPEQIEIHAHIEAVVTYLNLRLASVDAQIVNFSSIDNIRANLDEITSDLSQLPSDPGNRALLDRADAHADGSIAFIAQVPAPTGEVIEDLREIGARYRKSMTAQVAQLSASVNTLTQSASDLASELASHQEQLAADEQRIEASLTTTTASFVEAQTIRDDAFAAQNLQFEAQLKKALEEAEQSASTALEELQKKSETAWREVAALKKRAETASNYLGIASVAGGYSDTADSEAHSAFWLRIGAIASFLGAVAASVFALIYHVTHPFTLDGFFAKASLALPILLLAGYLARESSRHSERADFNRQRQRQLESLPAYVDGLQVDRRALVYEALAPGFFSTPALNGKPEDAVRSNGGEAAQKVIELLLDEMKKRAGA
jgi:hypothetical protein